MDKDEAINCWHSLLKELDGCLDSFMRQRRENLQVWKFNSNDDCFWVYRLTQSRWVRMLKCRFKQDSFEVEIKETDKDFCLEAPATIFLIPPDFGEAEKITDTYNIVAVDRLKRTRDGVSFDARYAAVAILKDLLK